jgi:hypothetical protein
MEATEGMTDVTQDDSEVTRAVLAAADLMAAMGDAACPIPLGAVANPKTGEILAGLVMVPASMVEAVLGLVEAALSQGARDAKRQGFGGYV